MHWILAESRPLRFFSFTLFYVAQGLPIGLISIALPAYLAGEGATAGQVASFVAISGLPWGFKFFAGPVMDRFSYLPMGRRRPWVVFAQFALLLGIASMGLVPDPVDHIMILTGSAFLVNTFAAVQDVAVDGMAIDVLPVEERGRANAFMAFGQVAGYSGSAALSALALSIYGIEGAALLLASGVGLIFSWSVVVRERRNEKRLPWTRGEANPLSAGMQADNWHSIAGNLVKVLFLPASVLLVFMTFFWRVADGFWITFTPVVVTQELGYASTQYSNWNAIAGFTAATIGLLVGPLIDRRGARKILILSVLGYAAISFFAGLNPSLWTLHWFPLLVLFTVSFFSQGVFISFIAIHMNICWQQVSATQFAIYMAWANLSRSIGAGIYGYVEPWLEAGQEFHIMGVCCVLAAVFVSRVDLQAHHERIDRLR